MIRIALKANKEGKKVEIEGGSDEEIKLISVPLSIIFIIGGAAAIAFGGDLTVDAASRIASDLGMTQTLIGLTIVSIGTSLPELVTSIVAARKNEVDMALGNAIGSNVFNILMVLGIASAISPISIMDLRRKQKENRKSRRLLYGGSLRSICGLYHNQINEGRTNDIVF